VSGNKQRRFTNEFKREAVPMTSGPSVERVANDLGIAKSTLSRLRSEHEQADLLEGPHEDASKELARLRKENGILLGTRDSEEGRVSIYIAKRSARPPSGRRSLGPDDGF
jgi:transposase